MKNKLTSILLSTLISNYMGTYMGTQEQPKDTYCSRGYWGVTGIFYVDTENQISKLVETYEFELLRCLEYKVKEPFKKTNEVR